MEGASEMQKHNLYSVKEEKTDRLDKPVEKIAVKPAETKTVRVRLQIDANYNVTGKFSGRGYLFRGAGSVNDVDERDVEFLLGLRQGRGCCGGGGGSALFELA